jgi:dihydrolipoamide dehydrogenase
VTSLSALITVAVLHQLAYAEPIMRLLFINFSFLIATASSFVIVPRTTLHSVAKSSSATVWASQCGTYDFDVAIIGCGVGGHGAALHSRAQGLNTAVFAGSDVGGTCVNRGCVPSKALLAASGRVREMRNADHLASFGIQVQGEVTYDRAGIAAHAKNLANKVKGNLEASLTGLGVEVIEGRGVLTASAHEIKDEKTGKIFTAKVKDIF